MKRKMFSRYFSKYIDNSDKQAVTQSSLFTVQYNHKIEIFQFPLSVVVGAQGERGAREPSSGATNSRLCRLAVTIYNIVH